MSTNPTCLTAAAPQVPRRAHERLRRWRKSTDGTCKTRHATLPDRNIFLAGDIMLRDACAEITEEIELLVRQTLFANRVYAAVFEQGKMPTLAATV